jgi:hypothetical protein
LPRIDYSKKRGMLKNVSGAWDFDYYSNFV